MKYRLHVVSLPHTQTTSEYLSCAFTQKVIKFCTMMKQMGNEVILYASEENEAPCDELVTCITKEEQKKYINVDHYVKVSFDTSLPLWNIFLTNVTKEIQKRKKPRDFLCLCMGTTFEQLSNDVGKDMLVVETGIGYAGVFAPYKVFESYAQMHAVYAQNRNSSSVDGNFFDTVIPNYFNVSDFPFEKEKDNYLLYMGRMVQRKGLKIVEEIANATGKHIILAGMGAKQDGDIITCQDITIKGKTLTYVGEVGVIERGKLMSKAQAVLCPTLYVEPFCGVSVEAMLCGTPVISTDWGAFTETIIHGETGMRCHTLKEFCEATDIIWNYEAIRNHALIYSMDVIKYRYQKYFDRLYTLWDKGWYTI